MNHGLAGKRGLHILLPLFIGSVIAYLDRVNIAYAALTMNKDLGFSAQVFGMGAGIFFIGYVLFEVPGALIAERWSPRIWLARIMVTWGVVSELMVFIHGRWQFYLVRFFLGAAEASYYPVAYASVLPRWFAPEERPRAIAIMLTSLQVSAIIGSPFAAWLLDISIWGLKGWQILFVAEALPALVFGIVIYFWLPDWPRQARWLSEDEKQALSRAYDRDVERKNAVHTYSVIEALRNREVLKLCLIYFLWITGFWGFNYWMPTVLKEASGWSNMGVGWAVVIPMSLSLVGMLFVGHSSSRTGEKRWHGAVPMFLAAAGMGIGTYVQHPMVNLAFVCFTAIGVYGAFGVWWSYPTSFLSGTAAAGAVGLINSFGNIGGYVGAYLIGAVKDWTASFHPAYLFLAASLLVSGLLMLTCGSGNVYREKNNYG
ncbi:MAG TPA: MFS transporter [Acidobacteriota bacterium]|nr:MFS transporter [Acidobacteriota bacterium]